MTLLAPFRKPRSGTVRSLCLRTPFHGCSAALLACVFLLGGVTAHAQGRGGPGGGGMMGGGGNHAGFNDRGVSPRTERAPVRSGAQLGLTGRWWDDDKTARKLNLRSDQLRRMDDIFEANKGSLIASLGNLQREETHLASLSPKELQDQTKVFAAIDRVAQARADLEKANARVLMQIRMQMDTVQLAALDREIAAAR